jgi:hypothetical protein
LDAVALNHFLFVRQRRLAHKAGGQRDSLARETEKENCAKESRTGCRPKPSRRFIVATMRSHVGIFVALALLLGTAMAGQGLYAENSAINLSITKDNFAELVLDSNAMYVFILLVLFSLQCSGSIFVATSHPCCAYLSLHAAG